MDEVLFFGEDDFDILDIDGYELKPSSFFNKLPEIAKPLVKNANKILSEVEKMLYSAPAFIHVVQSSIPEEVFQAILSPEQQEQIAQGVLKLMTKKDSSLLAVLVDTNTNKIIGNVPLKSVKLTPELNKALADYSSQIQMAQIAEEFQNVQYAIDDVRKGQDSYRLAIAYSCQQKLLQAREISDPNIRTMMLLQVISDAEDSRNLLMLSQKSNVNFIKEQPDSTWGKLLKGDKPDKIEARMNEIRDGLAAVNIVSLSAAIAYNELGEKKAAQKSLDYFGKFINETYLSSQELVERLDLLDPSPTNYWTKELPKIETSIMKLPNQPDSIETEVLE